MQGDVMTYEDAFAIMNGFFDGEDHPVETLIEATSIISRDDYQKLFDKYMEKQKQNNRPKRPQDGKLTHRQLCDLAGRFLRHIQHYDKILIETGYRTENPDAFGIDKHGSTLIECKASRSDFLADRRKPFRINPSKGIGMTRFYLVNEGVIKSEDDVPPGWQVLVAKDKDTIEAYTNYSGYKPQYTPKDYWFEDRNYKAELELLWSWFYREEHGCLKEIGEAPQVYFVNYKWTQSNGLISDMK